jgi:hypothetical protein
MVMRSATSRLPSYSFCAFAQMSEAAVKVNCWRSEGDREMMLSQGCVR